MTKNVKIEDLAIMIKKGFDSVDKRFKSVDKRFDLVDSRFNSIDERFDLVDERFDSVEKEIKSLGELGKRVDLLADDMRVVKTVKEKLGIK